MMKSLIFSATPQNKVSNTSMDVTLRAWPLTLHLHMLMYFYIRIWKLPTHCPKYQTWMKSDFGSPKLLAHVRDMQGG